MQANRRTLAVAGALTAGAAATTGLIAVRRRRARRRAGDERPHVITVYRPLDEVRAQGERPGRLAGLGDDVEVQLRAAPGGRGTEIAARRRDGSAATAGDVRRALRETRSLLETGDVLLPDAPTTTPTLFNKPLRAVTGRGREGGLL